MLGKCLGFGVHEQQLPSAIEENDAGSTLLRQALCLLLPVERPGDVSCRDDRHTPPILWHLAPILHLIISGVNLLGSDPTVAVLSCPQQVVGQSVAVLTRDWRKIQIDRIGTVFGKCASQLFRTAGGPTRHSGCI